MNEVAAEFVLPEGMKDGTFEIVVANILANPLKLLAPALLGRVAPGADSSSRACLRSKPTK